ncbi:MAG: alpha/beta hydrolase superfamily enzyme predicted hydrolase [Fibrobacteres bacterium]|nr:alpha/beta hydrolase superfamily enzyme predicted hydrolase [Fibrobacterota bacterium]
MGGKAGNAAKPVKGAGSAGLMKGAKSAKPSKPRTRKPSASETPASAPAKTGFLLPGKEGHVLLAHGAGGHMDHPHILALAGALAATGLTPLRFDFPYRAEGRKFPDRMPVLVERFREEAECLTTGEKPGFLILAGHSMGTRAALALASGGHPCRGLILFSYPLHPPGHPEKLRLDHMEGLNVPVLSLSGTKDAFCTPRLMDKAVAKASRWTHHWIEGADHGLMVPKRSGRTRGEVLAEVESVCRAWLAGLPKR